VVLDIVDGGVVLIEAVRGARINVMDFIKCGEKAVVVVVVVLMLCNISMVATAAW